MMQQSSLIVFNLQSFSELFLIDNVPIGEGHDAKVFKILEKQTQKIYALKVLKNQNPKQRINIYHLRIKNEAFVLNGIEHLGITKLYGYSDDWTCLLLEHMPNGNFFHILKKTAPLPLPIAKTLIRHLAESVDFLHSNGISHCDIKPENMLISEDFVVKICDFGFAKSSKVIKEFISNIGFTAGYAPPEAHYPILINEPQERHNFFVKWDTFSLGVVIFIVIVGRPPFFDNNPQKQDQLWLFILRNDWATYWKIWQQNQIIIPEELKRIVESLLEPSNDKRGKISELLSKEWLKSNSATMEEVKMEIQKRLSNH